VGVCQNEKVQILSRKVDVRDCDCNIESVTELTTALIAPNCLECENASQSDCQGSHCENERHTERLCGEQRDVIFFPFSAPFGVELEEPHIGSCYKQNKGPECDVN
jgi:hypothetical protein